METTKTPQEIENERFAWRVQSLAKACHDAAQNLVNEFNKLDIRNLDSDELHTLLNEPKFLIQKRINEIEVPEQFIREKYLELLKMPDFTRVLNAPAPREMSAFARCFILNGTTVEVKTSELEKIKRREGVVIMEF